MSNSKSVIVKRRKMDLSYNKVEEAKKKLDKHARELQSQCNHDIVLKIPDHKPHKIGEMYTFCCPACYRRERIHALNRFEQSPFRSSKIIDLSNLRMLDVYTFQIMMGIIHQNYEYYYHSDATSNELALALNKSLLEYFKQKQRHL